METVLPSAGTLSRFIVIKSNYYSDKGYAHYDKDGFALLGEESVFSEMVKIEAERATISDRYVNLRFCHSNNYWERKESRFIVAESNKPEEDTTKSTCTLFEAVSVVGGNGLFYLNHVQSGGRLLFEEPSMRFYVQPNPNSVAGYLSFVNWNDLVKLPKNVAFKGDNERYLGGIVLRIVPGSFITKNYLQFSFDDPNAQASIQEVHLMNDGHVRIKSKRFDRFWRRANNWILVNDTDTTANNRDTLFWPVKIDETTIALRNAGNNQFCKRLTSLVTTDCLSADVNTITTEARLVVEELVLETRIFNVRYWVENSRIFNETPFVAGSTTAFNYSDSEAAISVEVSYEDSESTSFSRSLFLTFGSKIEFQAGIPKIASNKVEVSFEINTTLEWNKTTTTTTSVKATGTVVVPPPPPPRSIATVSYVGTMGTCDVPFSYTQQDRRSTDGQLEEIDHIDGVFRGVNSYNFTFVVEKSQPL